MYSISITVISSVWIYFSTILIIIKYYFVGATNHHTIQNNNWNPHIDTTYVNNKELDIVFYIINIILSLIQDY